MLSRAIIAILGLVVTMTGVNYSMELASAKSHFAFLGWIGFIISIYIFWVILKRYVFVDKKTPSKNTSGSHPASHPTRRQ